MASINPITEDEIANYLVHTPEFFARHAQLLVQVQLGSPHGSRAVSLQQRQAEMLREKIKALEHRIMDMVRHGNENVMTGDRLQRWTRGLLEHRQARELPHYVTEALQSQFMVPQAGIKLWDLAPDYADEPYARGVSDDIKAFASSLTAPFCGLNAEFEAAGWLAEPAAAVSLAMLPLRSAGEGPAFGLLVLASPDAQRYQADMGTDFLERIGELAAAALSRLR